MINLTDKILKIMNHKVSGPLWQDIEPLYAYHRIKEHINNELRGEIPTVHS